MEILKIGFLSVGHSDYINESSMNLTKQAVKNLENKGIKVIFHDKTAADSKTARRMAKDLLKQEIDGIIIFLATWIECPVAMSVVREIEHLPFALWGMPMFENKGELDSTGSFVSFAMFKGSLDRLEYKYKSIMGIPDDSDAVNEAIIFCKAASAYERLKRTAIGLVGYTSMGIYPGTFDHLYMRKVIGPEIVQMDTYTLVNRMKDIKDNDCSDVIDYLKSTARIRDDVAYDDLLIVSKMYLALKKICSENDLKAVNVKCQYELSKEFGMTACVPLSILAENNIIASCEGDIPVTVSMMMLNLLSGSITAYADIININKNNTIKMSPCGFIPYSMGMENKREIRKFMPGVGFKGIQNSFVFKPGKVTLLRLVEGKGSYHIIYLTGEGLPTKLRQGYMPALDIRIDGEIDNLIDNFAGQHYAMCYGDYSNEIKELSRIIGIDYLEI